MSLSQIIVSVSQFSHSVMSDSLWTHGLQHARPTCPLSTSTVYSNSTPLRWWCHPTISSFVVLFSFCLQSFPASGSFPRSQSFTSGGLSIGVSASASVLPMNIQDWFPLGWTVWISFQSKGVFSKTSPRLSSLKSLLQQHNSKASILWCSAFFIVSRVLYLSTLLSLHHLYVRWIICQSLHQYYIT